MSAAMMSPVALTSAECTPPGCVAESSDAHS
jgi:hypothetical protein